MTATETFRKQFAAYSAIREQVKAECRTSEALRALVNECRAAIGEELAALGVTSEDAISWKAKRLLRGAN